MPSVDIRPYRVEPGCRTELAQLPSRCDGGFAKAQGKKRVAKLHRRLRKLQRLLFAANSHAILIVLQAMDAAGKDSTIRRCFGPINPQGCRTTPFDAPTEDELAHDFLWRVHRELPRRGLIGVFNRSHYEDVLIARVQELVPEPVWRGRYAHINAFEEMLTDEGTVILKFYLHVSKDYQKRRLERRLSRPDKLWKFDPSDLQARSRWEEYMGAYEDVFDRCSTASAPWHVVPSERRWFRDLVILQTLVEALEGLHLQRPPAQVDPEAAEIP